MNPMYIHASCVSIAGQGVLIRGLPGSGKSELALRLIDQSGFGAGDVALKAVLVADDQTGLDVREGRVFACPHERLAGLLELRGLGILVFPYVRDVPLTLVVDLAPSAQIERLPLPEATTTELGGVSVRRIVLDRVQPAAPALVRAALTAPFLNGT